MAFLQHTGDINWKISQKQFKLLIMAVWTVVFIYPIVFIILALQHDSWWKYLAIFLTLISFVADVKHVRLRYKKYVDTHPVLPTTQHSNNSSHASPSGAIPQVQNYVV
uniref:Pecanex-like protein n=1 Tax=Steinernema glaseri TaxID=37863 RepID=A0A1I7XWT1_9BILA